MDLADDNYSLKNCFSNHYFCNDHNFLYYILIVRKSGYRCFHYFPMVFQYFELVCTLAPTTLNT